METNTQKQSPRWSGVEDSSSSNKEASTMYKAPSWAKDVDFGTAFDQKGSGYADTRNQSQDDYPPTKKSHGGQERNNEDARGRIANNASQDSTIINGQSPHRSPIVQQMSPGLNTPSKNSPTLTQSDRSTPRASARPITSAMLLKHQRVASASSTSGSPDYSRPLPSQLHSSADLYAAADSRPGTSMSMISNSIDESKEDRRDSSTSNEIAKRASVLSFQTAYSGAGRFEEGAPESQYFHPAQMEDMEILDKALPQRPWLTQPFDAAPSGTSSFSTSPDERNFPGGWGHSSKAWQTAEEGYPGAMVGGYSASKKPSSEWGSRAHSRSPRMGAMDEAGNQRQQLAPHPRPSSRQDTDGSPRLGGKSGTLLPSIPVQEPKQPARPKSMLRNDTTEELMSSTRSSPGPQRSLSPLPQSTVETTLEPSADASEPVPAANSETQVLAQESVATEQDAVASSSRKQQQEIASKNGHDQDLEAASPPALPSKLTPPSVPGKDKNLLSSSPLLDATIPEPLPFTAAVDTGSIPKRMPANRSPVLDFRQKPLAVLQDKERTRKFDGEKKDDATEREAEYSGRKQGEKVLSESPANGLVPMAHSFVEAGVGAHAARNHAGDQAGPTAFAAHMSKGGPRAALVSAPAAPPADRSPSPSIDTPPREPSPPPEGEVEARAEWERAQMRQMAERAKASNTKGRKTTFRGQLKPLQLVAAEETKRAEKNGVSIDTSGPSNATTPLGSPSDRIKPRELSKVPSNNNSPRQFSNGSGGPSAVAMSASPVIGSSVPTNGSSANQKSGGLSTQQLQRQLARDQRRSVSAVNMALGQMGVSDIGGAYPVFPSPSTSAVNTSGAGRQYPGLMPQRSLVPPFELQNRPDGLPSALIGPDGVRRNLNDPEVCLECMMRDEDMIDVHVLGAELWERESDREFAEAIRLECEEDSKREKARAGQTSPSTTTHGGTLESVGTNTAASSEGMSKTMQGPSPSPVGPAPRLTKIRVKRVAKGDPLTVERLKLHTQMNPPASSHRWKTLQTFLAVQAKYIAMEQKARGAAPTVPPKSDPPSPDNRMSRTQSGDSRSAPRQRVASPSLLQVAENPTDPTSAEKAQKERDIVNAREARRRNNLSGPEVVRSPRIAEGPSAIEDPRTKRFSGPPLPNENSSGHNSIPRRSTAASNAFLRAGSIQDLREMPNSTAGKKEVLQPPLSPSESLAPPSAPFHGSSSPTWAGSNNRMRTVSSQMSLAGSGSMIDMHVGMEDRREHRISQAGFMPGTPLHSRSPSALNKAFYGFPGDSDPERAEEWTNSRQYDQSLGTSFGDYDDSFATSRGSPELERKRKKTGGFRNLFSRISGKEGASGSDALQSPRPDEGSLDSQRRKSIGPDSGLDLPPPPGLAGLLSKARRSTSSLLIPSGRQSMDSTMMLGDRSFNNPLMASQTSLELGPFGSGPLPPPRKESRFSQAQLPAPSNVPVGKKEKEKNRLRTFSSGNLLRKKGPPIPSSRSSSIMNAVPLGGNSPSAPNDPYSTSTVPSASHPLAAKQDIQYRSGRQGMPIDSSAQLFAHHEHNRSSPVLQRNNYSEANLGSGPTLQTSPTDGSLDQGNGPIRPPRSPHRDNQSGSSLQHGPDGPSQTMAQSLHIPPPLQKEQYYHAFDSPTSGVLSRRPEDQTQMPSGGSFDPVASPAITQASTPSRKSKLLKLPFGRNKRESTATVKTVGSNSISQGTPSLRSRSSRGTFDEFATNNASQSNGFGPPMPPQPMMDSLRAGPGWRNDGRPRINSGSWDERGLPPRSQSAMGMLDSTPSTGGMRSFLPRLRTNSRAALREVDED